MTYGVFHKKPYNSLIVLAILMHIMSCNVYKNNTSQSISSIEENPKIIFLNYKINKNKDGSKTLQFQSKKIVAGKFKQTNSNVEGIQGDLICNQLDENSQVLQSNIIKNPLEKTIEYLDSSNSFQLKQIDLDSAYFSFRLKLKPNTKYIAINNISNFDDSSKPLIKTNINN
ncbi:MAG: hypothetical protein HKO01_12425 [Flaviramulus sp.]|nr:hypothetical protein [Flaviramulus sp.]NNC51326.1 hypothetical protein [Flaviramulus sp.]